MGLTRREALGRLAGVVGLAACGDDVPEPAPARVVMPACDVDAIVTRMLDVGDTFPILREELMRGTSTDLLYDAALTAWSRVIYESVDMHAALVVHAARLLSSRVSQGEALVPLFRAWVQKGGAEVVWPLNESDVPTAEDAPVALLDALEAWDTERAEGAMLALYAAGGREAVVEPIARYGQRNHVWVGHDAIWAAHAIRALDSVGWGCAPHVLRSLARAFTVGPEGASTGAFEANLQRLGEVPTDWRVGVDDPLVVPALLDVFRVADSEGCVDEVLRRLADGVSARTLWTALAVTAVDQAIRWQEDSFAVHELDTINALRNLQSLTRDPDTEILALLQAAAWRPEFRVKVDGRAPRVEEGIDALVRSSTPEAELPPIFEAIASDRVEAARRLASYLDQGDVVDVISAWPDVVVRYASEDAHHYKFHIALIEEAEASLPEWRDTLMLGITIRGPTTAQAPWERYDEARDIIDELG